MGSINAFQILNGLTFSALLFIVASGFTLTFGLLKIANLSHGSMYLVGGYIGYFVTVSSGSFLLGVLASMAGVAVLGFMLDQGLLRFMPNAELRQVLLTLGVAFILNDLALVVFGGDTYTVPTPTLLKGAVHFESLFYTKYRLFVLALGVLVFAVLWLLINKTRLGALIRAGVDDTEMIGAMGINIKKVFMLTFMLGSALAGLGGMIGGVFLTLYPTADVEILVFSMAVVIIGGMGSLAGAAVGSLIVGMLNIIGQTLFPELAYFVIFGPMALILAFRPMGLFGRAA